MRIHIRTSIQALLVLSGISLCSAKSFAGVIPPCVGATLSGSKHVLVTNELTLSDLHEAHNRKVIGSTFHVLQEFRHVEGVNDGLRFTSPDNYWGEGSFGSLWSVRFPPESGTDLVACPYVLVTDDAEFLVLVINTPSVDALCIYRRREHPGHERIAIGPDLGVLVRTISANEIIPPPASEQARWFTDHSPQWYSHGAFSFTEDQRTLVYRDTTVGVLRVDLATGSIAKGPGSDVK